MPLNRKLIKHITVYSHAHNMQQLKLYTRRTFNVIEIVESILLDKKTSYKTVYLV